MSSLLCDDKFIIDFKEKAELFNEKFTKKYSLANNSSKRPAVLTKKSHYQQLNVRQAIFQE